jgi:hypothetical protein
MLPWKVLATQHSVAAKPAAPPPTITIFSRPSGAGVTRPLGAASLLAHEHLAVTQLGRPARDGTERRRAQRLSGAQAEAGVVPWQRTVSPTISPSASGLVVAAFGADREVRVAAAREQNRGVAHMAEQHLAVASVSAAMPSARSGPLSGRGRCSFPVSCGHAGR